MSTYDVVVIGGGPGGSVCATTLANGGGGGGGARVLVLERATFPRFHLGESLLPQSLPVLEAIGVLPEIDATFLQKHGARFWDEARGRHERFSFDGAWKTDRTYAYEVQRGPFDKILLDHAARSGAEVRHGWTVSGPVRNAEGRIVGVFATDADGNRERFDARWVVDASGRDALFAHGSRTTEKIVDLDQASLFAHYRGVPRQEGKLAGDIDIVIFRPTPTARPNWFWLIPFKDGTTSVGAVVSRAWLRSKRANLDSADVADPTRLLQMAIAESRAASDRLANATMIWPAARAAADFSYRVRELTGPGWLAVGDAGGFIDPLFSTGAHLAICGGHSAARAILDVLGNADADERATFAAWEAKLRAGAEMFVLAVQAFYAGPLLDTLFLENKHHALRRSVTSLLAGDVFTDAIWLRDARLRIADMLKHSAAAE